MYQLGAVTTTTDADDLRTIAEWAQVTRDLGGVPTRIPLFMENAGELADRFSGPGTDFPNEPPALSLCARDSIRSGDADHRLQARGLSDAVNKTVPDAPIGTNLLAGLGLASDWSKWLKYGAIAAAVLVVVLVCRPEESARPTHLEVLTCADTLESHRVYRVRLHARDGQRGIGMTSLGKGNFESCCAMTGSVAIKNASGKKVVGSGSDVDGDTRPYLIRSEARREDNGKAENECSPAEVLRQRAQEERAA